MVLVSSKFEISQHFLEKKALLCNNQENTYKYYEQKETSSKK